MILQRHNLENDIPQEQSQELPINNDLRFLAKEKKPDC